MASKSGVMITDRDRSREVVSTEQQTAVERAAGSSWQSRLSKVSSQDRVLRRCLNLLSG